MELEISFVNNELEKNNLFYIKCSSKEDFILLSRYIANLLLSVKKQYYYFYLNFTCYSIFFLSSPWLHVFEKPVRLHIINWVDSTIWTYFLTRNFANSLLWICYVFTLSKIELSHNWNKSEYFPVSNNTRNPTRDTCLCAVADTVDVCVCVCVCACGWYQSVRKLYKKK